MNETEIVLKRVDEFYASLWDDYCAPGENSVAWARVLEVTPTRGHLCRVRLRMATEVYEKLTAGLSRKRDIERAVYDGLQDAVHACLDHEVMWLTLYELPVADYVHPSFLAVDWSLSQAFDVVASIRGDEGEAGKVMFARATEDAGDRATLYVRLPDSLLAALEADGWDAPLSERVYSVIMTARQERANSWTSGSSTEFDRKLDDEIPF